MAAVTSRHWITRGCSFSGLWGGGWILAQGLWSWQGHSVQQMLPFSSPLLGACAAGQLGTAVSSGHTQNSDQSMSTHMCLACCGRNLSSQNMRSFFLLLLILYLGCIFPSSKKSLCGLFLKQGFLKTLADRHWEKSQARVSLLAVPCQH